MNSKMSLKPGSQRALLGFLRFDPVTNEPRKQLSDAIQKRAWRRSMAISSKPTSHYLSACPDLDFRLADYSFTTASFTSPKRYDPRLLRMQLHAAVVSGIGLPLLSSGAMRASPNYATFTESSVPLLSGSVTEINPLPGSRINSRKSGSALSFITYPPTRS